MKGIGRWGFKNIFGILCAVERMTGNGYGMDGYIAGRTIIIIKGRKMVSFHINWPFWFSDKYSSCFALHQLTPFLFSVNRMCCACAWLIYLFPFAFYFSAAIRFRTLAFYWFAVKINYYRIFAVFFFCHSLIFIQTAVFKLIQTVMSQKHNNTFIA